MSRRLRNMAAQREALRRSVEDFGPKGLAEPSWQETFASADPDDVNRALQVVGGYEHLVGNLVELIKSAARTTGLVNGRRPRAGECFVALEQAGCLTTAQRTALDQLYRFSGRLGHASPDIAADEVELHVRAAVRQVPGLTRAVTAWLKTHGVELT